MSQLQQHLAAVRHAWQRTQILKALAVLLADAVIAVLALVTIDAIYHMSSAVRGTLLGAAAMVVAITAAWLIVRPLRRQISDEQVALYIEERFPELKGSLIASVEYEHRKAENALQTMLYSALMADCLRRAAKMDIKHVIDHRRLRQRAIAAGAMLLIFGAAVLINPTKEFRHVLTRVLVPWKAIKPTPREELAEKNRREARQTQELLLAKQEAAAKPVKIELSVDPGDTEIRRGSNLVVKASANRVTGPFTLKFLASDGQWRPLDMPEDPNLPDHFAVTLADLSEAGKYKVAMGRVESREYSIKVFDPTAVKEFTLTYHYPKYTRMPDLKLANGNVDALEGTQVDLQFSATAALKEGTMTIEGVGPVPVKLHGDQATASFTVKTNGQYQLAATDLRGDKVFGFDPTYLIKANKDAPPTLDVLYPGSDSAVHPMEEIGFATKVTDDIGIKEVRLVSTYGLEKPTVQKIDCTTTPLNVTNQVAQFMISLAKRPKVETADTLTFHFEVEDLKGQVASSDVYLLTVRKIESFASYTAAEGESARTPAVRLMTIIGATHDLEMKRKGITLEELKKECAKIGKYLISEE